AEVDAAIDGVWNADALVLPGAPDVDRLGVLVERVHAKREVIHGAHGSSVPRGAVQVGVERIQGGAVERLGQADWTGVARTQAVVRAVEQVREPLAAGQR